MDDVESNIWEALDGGALSMRIGLHAGATVGGVVGKKMLRYHLFGPPLEGVTRMEQACDHGGVRQGRTTNRSKSLNMSFSTFRTLVS